jgi:Sugar efflux transporter for intercellular exchange
VCSLLAKLLYQRFSVSSSTQQHVAAIAEVDNWKISSLGAEELDLAISSLCTVAACYLFYSPMAEMRAVRKQMRVGDRTFFPFVSTWLAASLWTVYGVYIGAIFPVAACNAFGVYCASFYCFVYIAAEGRPKVRQSAINAFLAASVVVSAVCLYVGITTAGEASL